VDDFLGFLPRKGLIRPKIMVLGRILNRDDYPLNYRFSILTLILYATFCGSAVINFKPLKSLQALVDAFD
jgi:hypothetical protein